MDYKLGEQHFAATLWDYDPVLNNAGWQMAASVGCDSRPYYLIYNPVTQSEQFDRPCAFIKQELACFQDLPPKQIHGWQAFHGQHPGLHPCPIVDHVTQKGLFLYLYAPLLRPNKQGEVKDPR